MRICLIKSLRQHSFVSLAETNPPNKDTMTTLIKLNKTPPRQAILMTYSHYQILRIQQTAFNTAISGVELWEHTFICTTLTVGGLSKQDTQDAWHEIRRLDRKSVRVTCRQLGLTSQVCMCDSMTFKSFVRKPLEIQSRELAATLTHRHNHHHHPHHHNDSTKSSFAHRTYVLYISHSISLSLCIPKVIRIIYLWPFDGQRGLMWGANTHAAAVCTQFRRHKRCAEVYHQRRLKRRAPSQSKSHALNKAIKSVAAIKLIYMNLSGGGASCGGFKVRKLKRIFKEVISAHWINKKQICKVLQN